TSAIAPGCRDQPASCAKGTTCWPTDERGSFACLPSKDYKPRGSDCELLAGHTSCADALVCVTSDRWPDANAPRSYCAAYCDPMRAACSAGERCLAVVLFDGAAASTVYACVQNAPDAEDGGTRD